MNEPLIPGLGTADDLNVQRSDITTTDVDAVPAPESEDGLTDGQRWMQRNDLYNRLVGENHIFPSLQRAFRDKGEYDSEFLAGLTPERISSDLQKMGVNGLDDAALVDIAGAINEEDYWYRIGRAEEKQALDQDLAELGGASALAVQLGSYLSDPASFLVDAVTGVGAKGRLAARFLKGGSQAGMAEAIIQAGLNADGESVDPHDVATGMTLSFVLGGGIGAAFGRSSDDIGRELMEAQERATKASRAEAEFDDSAGAARNRGYDPLLDGKVEDLEIVRERLADDVKSDYKPTLKDRLVQGARFDDTRNMQRRAGKNVAQQGLLKRITAQFIETHKDKVNRISSHEVADIYVGRTERAVARDVASTFNRWLKSAHGMSAAQRIKTGVFNGGRYTDMRQNFMDAVGEVMRRREEAFAQYQGEVRRLLDDADDPHTVDLPDFVEPDLSDFSPEIAEAGDHFFGSFARQKKELQARGIYKGENKLTDVDNLVPDNPYYVPRRLSRRKAVELEQLLGPGGRDDLIDLFERSLRQGREHKGLEVVDSVNRAVARAYVDRLIQPRHSNGVVDMDLKFLDEADFDEIKELLEGSSLSKAEVADTLEKLQAGVKANQKDPDIDAANIERLKHRLPMDTSASLKVTRNGQEHTISVRDFFESNIEDIHFDYIRQVGGEVGYSTVGLSARDMETLIRQADLEADRNAHIGDPTKYTKEQVDDLRYAHARNMGRSLNEGFSGSHVRAARAATGIGFITRMGSAWWNALVETGTIIAAAGGGRVLRNMPAYRDIMKSMRDGTMEPQYLRELFMLNGGLGDTMVRGLYSNRHEASEIVSRFPERHGKTEQVLARIEDRIEGLKKGAAYVNLLGTLTDISRKAATVNAMSTLDDIYYRGMKAPGWWKARAKSWGLSDEDAARIGEWLKSDKVRRGKHGEIESLGLEEMPLDLRDTLSGFMYRYTGEMIQHVQQGSLPRWMQKNPWMRVLTQFRSFTTAAWTKHLLKDIHHADMLAAQKLVITGGLATFAYMGRTHLDYYGTEEFDKRMTPKAIFSAGFNYSVNASLLPAIIDQVSQVTPFEAPFAMARTSGLDSSFISTDLNSVPVAKYAGDVGRVLQYAGDNVSSVVQGNGLVAPTKTQMRSATNALMIQTMWPLKPLLNRAVDQFGRDPDERETINLWE